MTAAEPGLVSIVIPTFNRAPVLEAAIDSALAQTYRNFEIVVVDDGSTDDTLQRLDRRRSSKLRVLTTARNGGPARARNLGIRHCEGEYVAFLDSDDRWMPWKLEAQVQCFRSGAPRLGAVYSGRRVTLDDGSLLEIRPRLRGAVFDELVRRNPVPLPTLLVKRAVLDHVGVFDPDLPACEDWDLVIRIARHYDLDFVAEPAVAYDGTGADRMSARARSVFIANHRIFRRFARCPADRAQLAAYLALQSRELLHLERPRLAARYALASLRIAVDRDEKLALRTLRQVLRRHPVGRILTRLYAWRTPAAWRQST